LKAAADAAHAIGSDAADRGRRHHPWQGERSRCWRCWALRSKRTRRRTWAFVSVSDRSSLHAFRDFAHLATSHTSAYSARFVPFERLRRRSYGRRDRRPFAHGRGRCGRDLQVQDLRPAAGPRFAAARARLMSRHRSSVSSKRRFRAMCGGQQTHFGCCCMALAAWRCSTMSTDRGTAGAAADTSCDHDGASMREHAGSGACSATCAPAAPANQAGDGDGAAGLVREVARRLRPASAARCKSPRPSRRARAS